MINPVDAAKYFIVRAYEDSKDSEIASRDIEITNLKVQKLLYYSQSLYLALYEEPLFQEEIQAWRYGPVCPPAYYFYSKYEADQLPVPTEIPEFTSQVISVLKEVWEYFGEYHAYVLSGRTHLEFPWKKARKGLSSEAGSREPINLDDMIELGKQKLIEIEKNNPVYKSVVDKVLEGAFSISSSSSSKILGKGEVRGWLNSLLD